MVNSGTGYLANLSSSVYKTTNGGINWFAQPTGTSLSCISIAFVSVNDLCVTTSEGSVIKTSNGGSNWSVQYNSTGNPLYSIILRSGFGCCVGSSGIIIASSNSGASWSLNTRGTEDEVLSDIFFINQQTGWAAGWQGIIYSSTTGGRIWNKQISNTTAQLNSVCFINAQTGFAAGNAGILVSTTNGGAGWVSSGIAIENLRKIRFINSATGFVCGDNGTLLKTTNSGFSWTQVSSGTAFNLQDISFSGASTGYSVTSFNPTALKSTNGGLNWIPLPLSVNGAYSVSFVNENTGFVKSALVNNLVKTTNGGASWNNITDPGGFYVRFRSPNLGWSVGGTAGDSLLIAATGNGGQTWNRYTSKIINTILEIFMLTDSVGWCVSNSGFIFKTTNGGGALTGIMYSGNSLPGKYRLGQNYPNPFNPVTHIEFSLPETGFSELKIYDIQGRELLTLAEQELKAGTYIAQWNASGYSSGVYFYKLTSQNFTQTKKMVLIK
jgi:photosystem II stability/assembly factor-like uncharacterized protein